MPADDYEERVAPAVTALSTTATAVLGDLHPSIGGVGWWDEHLDFPRRAVLSEYLLDSLRGAAEALLDAALEAKTHREAMTSENAWLRRVWAQTNASGTATNDDYVRSMRRDAQAKRRDRQLDTSATHVVSHLLRSLDCVAAALIIVGAVPRPVRRADWGHVIKLAEQCRDASTTAKLAPLGTPGRQVQADLLAHVLRAEEFGPNDWLTWLNETRNSRIHRGARTSWYVLYGNRRRATGLLRPFPTHPDLTDVELLGRTPANAQGDLFESLRLVRHSEAILDGCLDSMTRFVAVLAEAIAACWAMRRADPALLAQRAAQWQDLERVAEMNFPGYGEPPRVIGDEVIIAPELALRLQSAHVMDEHRSRWDE